jgi:hypothetical protein
MFINIRIRKCISSNCNSEEILKFFELEDVKSDLAIYNTPTFFWAAESSLLSHPTLLWK